MQFRRNADLRTSNTFGLPCVAERFYLLENPQDLQACFEQGVFRENPLILGGGSNVILPAKLTRPVLQYTASHCRTEASSEGDLLVVSAGKNWDSLVAETVAQQLRGIENLSLIPGTVGAAPVQNIGAYGVELCDVLRWVRVFDTHSGAIHTLNTDECNFAYRDSLFKQQPGRYFIVEVALALCRAQPFSLSYAGLQELSDNAELAVRDVRDRVIALRQSKLPDPNEVPNAGSFFKNPVVDAPTYRRLLTDYPELIAYAQTDEHYKLAAGWLIDRLGMKGLRLGRVGVHEKQALVLANYGGATQAELLALAVHIIERVKNAFGVALEIEPVIVD